MNFLADESVDRPIVNRVREDAHHVRYVAEMEPGTPDEVVLDRANREDAVLLTADKDFGELVFRQRRVSSGVALIRLAGLSPERKATIVGEAVRRYGERMYGAFTVITPGGVRVRRALP